MAVSIECLDGTMCIDQLDATQFICVLEKMTCRRCVLQNVTSSKFKVYTQFTFSSFFSGTVVDYTGTNLHGSVSISPVIAVDVLVVANRVQFMNTYTFSKSSDEETYEVKLNSSTFLCLFRFCIEIRK